MPDRLGIANQRHSEDQGIKEFCARADRTCHHGERFIVMQKMVHTVAIVPTTYGNRVKYKAMGNWDSTDKLVDYYLKLPEKA